MLMTASIARRPRLTGATPAASQNGYEQQHHGRCRRGLPRQLGASSQEDRSDAEHDAGREEEAPVQLLEALDHLRALIEAAKAVDDAKRDVAIRAAADPEILAAASLSQVDERRAIEHRADRFHGRRAGTGGLRDDAAGRGADADDVHRDLARTRLPQRRFHAAAPGLPVGDDDERSRVAAL